MSKNYRFYPPLAMDEVMEAFSRANHHGLEPLNFGKGVSSFNPFDYVDTQLSSFNLGKHVAYGDINGLMSLRQAICRYYQEKFDYDLTPERVCITDGASGALTIALAMLVESGGEIILPESCYPAYKIFAQIFEANCRFVPLKDNRCIDIEQLPRLISKKTQAIIINSPSNPYGAFLREDELEAITSLGIPVIFDEVYQPLSLTDEAIPSAIQFSDRHIIVNSFSKSLAIAGFRVGYMIVPEAQTQLMTNVKAILNMCTSLPSQVVAETLLGHWDTLVNKHRLMLRDNWVAFKRVTDRLDLKLLSQPEAGFFTTIDISTTRQNAMQVALELARHHAISSSPGIDFQDRDSSFLRLNFACDARQIETGLARIADYLACPDKTIRQVHPFKRKSTSFTRPKSLVSMKILEGI